MEAQAQKSHLLHRDPGPEAYPNPNPGGGGRGAVRLSQGERLRRLEKKRGTGTDLEAIKAKALVDALNLATEEDKIRVRLQMLEERKQQKQEAVEAALAAATGGAAQREALSRKAAIERAIVQAGGDPTPELMAKFGFRAEDAPAIPPIQDVLLPRRAGQPMPYKAPDETGTAPHPQPPQVQLPDETQESIEAPVDGIAARVMAELSAERAARKATPPVAPAAQPSAAEIAAAKALLASLGLEVTQPVPAREFNLTDAQVEAVGRVAAKRGRGRPKGSKNKPKAQ